jgi:hypothetical protein
VAVWLLVVAVGIEIIATYWRLPAGELYHVSGSGATGGASRLLVFLNFPVALIAIAVLALLLDRLRGRERLVAALGLLLCAPVFWPGVVSEADLDARPVNAVAASGVLVAGLLTFLAGRRFGERESSARTSARSVRMLVALLLLALALPWIAADLGLSFDGVPILGTLYQTGELRTQPGNPIAHPAVHHGHHHGMDGTLLALTVLLLAGVLWRVRDRRLQLAAAAYLALMFCYGVGNIANDFWLEQVVKRGWTSWEIPNVTTPKASVAWAVIVAAAAVVWAFSARRTRRPARVV